jgi:hypothetical protein
MGGAGGGIFSSGAINLSACTIYSNLAGIGGGGGSGGDGYGPGDGAIGGAGGTGGTAGGLFNQGNFSLLALTNCTLSGNSAGSGGAGGIGGSAEFDAGSGGNGGRGGRGGDCGGIYNENSLQLTACTVSSNRSGAGGSGGNGGADVGNPLDRDGGDGGIGGSGGNGGGIIASPNASLTSLRNTLIAQNTAGTLGLGGSGRDNGINGSSGTNGIRQDLLGTFTSAGHNFVGINDGGFSIANPMPTDLIPQPGFQINPLLGPLADNGGPTLTLALQRFGMLDSPAIDAGDDSLINTLATDQHGLPRRSGAHVDIGAFELQETVLASPPLLSQPEWLGSGGFKFSFSNVSDASFSVLSSTNIALPRSNWTLLGPATQNSPGHYLFTDPAATNFPQRYYQVVSP